MVFEDFDFTDIAGYEAGASTAYSSPAVPTVFDLNGAAGNASNMGTVSPQDLLIKEPFMSAPNSTALTNLTSPSIYNESPEFNDAFDVSPHFGSSDFDTSAGSANGWFPLFPDADTSVTSAAVPPTAAVISAGSDQSPVEKSDDAAAPQRPASGHQRRKSGSSPPGRHSTVSGVSSRRRDKPLPPIIVEDVTDVVAMKRARNTLAARKSRERKAMRLEELEDRIQKLEAERDHWKRIALARGAQP